MSGSPERIAKTPDGDLLLVYANGDRKALRPRAIRLACPCASCVDEFTGEPLLDPDSVPVDLSIQRVRTVGSYALAFQFSDGHHTGIYPWATLAVVS